MLINVETKDKEMTRLVEMIRAKKAAVSYLEYDISLLEAYLKKLEQKDN